MSNSKRYFSRATFIVVIIIGTFLVIYFYTKDNKNSNTTLPSNKNTENINSQTPATKDKEDLSKTISDVSKTLLINPKDAGSYIKKSEAEYALGQKEEALKTVEEGLKVAPDNELLKSRRDVLSVEWTFSQNQDTPKE